MAKALAPKTRIIRETILANPGLGPKALARLINEDEARQEDNVRVTPGDVANQQNAMRKAGASLPTAPARAPAPQAPTAPPAPAAEEAEEPAPPPRKPSRPRGAKPAPTHEPALPQPEAP